MDELIAEIRRMIDQVELYPSSDKFIQIRLMLKDLEQEAAALKQIELVWAK